jgi:hypothetical protein
VRPEWSGVVTLQAMPIPAPPAPPPPAPVPAPAPPAVSPKPVPVRPSVKGDPFERARPTKGRSRGKARGGASQDHSDPFDADSGKPGMDHRKSSPFR